MSPYALLFIGGFGLCLLGFAFVVYVMNRTQAQGIDATGHVNPLLVANEVRNDMEKIEWLTDMLLKQEFGKLKIGQIELLDEIRKFADHGVKQITLLLKQEQNAKNVAKILSPVPRSGSQGTSSKGQEA